MTVELHHGEAVDILPRYAGQASADRHSRPHVLYCHGRSATPGFARSTAYAAESIMRVRVWDPVEVFDHAPSYEEWLAVARHQADRFFWPKVQKTDGCWLWMAAVDKDGYGEIHVGALVCGAPRQKGMRAHRRAWEMVNGPVPAGLVLMHSCDNPRCVNPAHLSPGTQAQNRADCGAKGRNATGDTHGSRRKPERLPKGERHYKATMTEEDVRHIRAQKQAGVPMVRLAAEMGKSLAAIYTAASGRSWWHVQ